MSAKELGQIHMVNYSEEVDSTASFPKPLISVDLPGQLTEQLQTMVRAGTYHKVVGIDMTLDTVGTVGGGQITGFFRYFAPTRGRCEAFRAAFKAMKQQMTNQGVTTRTNPLYDFRAPINDAAHASGVFPNRATLDGRTGLALRNDNDPGASIFGVHNTTVRPQYTDADNLLFSDGFDTLLANLDEGNATDFVLNDTVPYTGNRNAASIEYEEIPFMLTWTPDSTDLAITWQWRPDPALFLAVLCGQLSCVIEEINVDEGASALNLNVAIMVSGWKSIMGDPSKRKRSNSKKKSEVTVKKK